jgi:hypothetical protein
MIEMPQWLNTHSPYSNFFKGVFQFAWPVIILASVVLEQKSEDLERDEVIGHAWVSLHLMGGSVHDAQGWEQQVSSDWIKFCCARMYRARKLVYSGSQLSPACVETWGVESCGPPPPKSLTLPPTQAILDSAY